MLRCSPSPCSNLNPFSKQTPPPPPPNWSHYGRQDLINAPTFAAVRQQVADLIRGKIVVGRLQADSRRSAALFSCLVTLCIFTQPAVASHALILGHALSNDWNALKLSHPPQLVRDTSAWGQSRFGYKRLPSLKFMCKMHLQLDVQDSAHSPAEDSYASMLL